ncbi:MAG: DNA alkylation repair protein [Nitrospirae bacterium]|nr:DNA alkylation repair protein [Nitrospirota bacterium]
MKKENAPRIQIKAFRDIMRAGGDKERAAFEKTYLKCTDKFFGTSVPFADRMAKDFRKRNEKSDREYIIALAKELFTSEYHDEKRLGLRILQYYPDYLDLSLMPLLEDMLMHSSTWDLIDDISIHLVSIVLEKDRKAYRYLKKWSRSESFWMRRASLISQILLFRKNRGDNKLFYSFAERMINEKEFFIRKAIGWSIREMAKGNADEAFRFLMKIRDRASGLTLREGAKRLPENMKAQVLGKE